MSDINWQKLRATSQKVGYRNILIKHFRLPDGNEHDFTVIDQRGGAAGVFGITAENKVIIARQFRPGLETVMDEIPGGNIDPGEDPIETAAREFQEETGYAGELEPLGSIARDAYIDGTWHYFLARNCKKVSEPQLGSHEFIEIIEMPIEELLNSITHARMTDPACALLALRKLDL